MTTIPPEAVAYGDQVHARTAASVDAAVAWVRSICHLSDDDMMLMIYVFAQMKTFTEEARRSEVLMLSLSLALVRLARTEANA